MKNVIGILLLLGATPFAGVQVFETANSRVCIELPGSQPSKVIDYTDTSSLPYDDATPAYIVLVDKSSGNDLDMAILTTDLKEYLNTTKVTFSGNLDQRNTAFFRGLFKDFKVTRLPLVANPIPVKKYSR